MKNSTILWADDDMDDLMLMRQILEDLDHSYDIHEVYNGREALDFLHQAKKDGQLPCLLILDMNMPVLNGRETLAILKSEEDLKDLPVVVFTTSSSKMDEMFCARFGVKMLTKPPNYDNLNDTIKEILNYCNR